jgi:hypothetical protein
MLINFRPRRQAGTDEPLPPPLPYINPPLHANPSPTHITPLCTESNAKPTPSVDRSDPPIVSSARLPSKAKYATPILRWCRCSRRCCRSRASRGRRASRSPAPTHPPRPAGSGSGTAATTGNTRTAAARWSTGSSSISTPRRCRLSGSAASTLRYVIRWRGLFTLMIRVCATSPWCSY